MSDGGRERREFQRVMLDVPIPARLGNVDVQLVEVGVPGARIKHRVPVPLGTADILALEYGGRPIQLEAEIVRTSLLERPDADGFRYQSGVRFVRSIEDSGQAMRELVFKQLSTLLRKLGGTPISSYRGIDGDRTIRGKDAGFISFRFENGSWRKKRIFLPEQPDIGFTVARGFDDEELQRVCDAYAKADIEGRRLLRLFAELSIAEVMGIPPKSA